VLARRSQRGPPLRVAYEDVRLAQTSPLAQELQSCTLEEELAASTDRPPHTNSNKPKQIADQPPPSFCRTLRRGGVRDAAESEPLSQVQEIERTSSAQNRSLMTTRQGDIAQRTERPMVDIGDTQVHSEVEAIGQLQSTRQKVLAELQSVLGKSQVTRSKLEFAPSWIVEEAFRSELKKNWAGAYEEVKEYDVPRHANVISSHVIYGIKQDESGTRKLKARLVVHGNRDSEKDFIRKDSSTAQFNVIRLLFSIASLLGLRLAMADITGAYLQSGSIRRSIYVRPPAEWDGSRGRLWKLKKLPYGIVEAGRQWAKAIEDWMLEGGGLERVSSISQLYIRINSVGTIILVVAKVTDDLLIARRVQLMNQCIEALSKRFEVGKSLVDSPFHFNGCEVEQDTVGNIILAMKGYMKQLVPIPLSRSRRKETASRATQEEISQYRSLAVIVLWLGSGVLPQASYSSTMQQKISILNVEHLREANEMAKELNCLKPWIKYCQPSNVTSAIVCSITDASFNICSGRDYGQTGLLAGLRIC